MEAKPRVWTIYCHTCTATGKKYVGQTCRDLRLRWQEHELDAQRGDARYLYVDMRAYGSASFVTEILEVVESAKAAHKAEKGWIERLGTLHPGGYNMYGGGSIFADTSFQRMSEIRKAAWAKLTPEQKTARAKRSPESNQKIGDKNRIRWAEKTPEQKTAIARKRMASMGPEALQAGMKAAHAALTPERRRAFALNRPPPSEETRAKMRASSQARWAEQVRLREIRKAEKRASNEARQAKRLWRRWAIASAVSALHASGLDWRAACVVVGVPQTTAMRWNAQRARRFRDTVNDLATSPSGNVGYGC